MLETGSRYFNSQPHKEADVIIVHCSDSGIFISTHSLTRRLTKCTETSWFFSNISTHSLTRRLTPTFLSGNRQRYHFNSQPHKEADSSTCGTPPSRKHFNSQPHKEADTSDTVLDIVKSISTHSLTRRLTNFFQFF